ncbi:MAG: 3-deoxy-D-manno-octulosonic acid transferase, partial [Pseudomonadota bacterium]
MAIGLRTLYTLVLHLLLPLVAAYLLLRCSREPGYCRGWRQRLGGGPGHAGAGPTGRPLWVHAASVGEVRAAAPLIRGLRQRYPECEVLITTTTPTGAVQVAEAFGSGVRHAYLPLDLPWAVSAFLRRWRPRLAVIMEMEFWPNLFHAVRRHRIPLLLANARLSAKSAGRYARLRPLVAATLRCPDAIAAQNDDDARRLRALGAPEAAITVTGSVKFDQPVPEMAPENGAALREELGGADRPVWIAASTREGEEEQVLAAHEQLRESHPTALLLLVPRHPQRFDRVAELCRERGHALVRRGGNGVPGPETAVYLG